MAMKHMQVLGRGVIPRQKYQCPVAGPARAFEALTINPLAIRSGEYPGGSGIKSVADRCAGGRSRRVHAGLFSLRRPQLESSEGLD